MNKNIRIFGGAAAVAVAIGSAAAGGYLFGKKKYEIIYAEMAAQEIADVKANYGVLRKQGDFATPESAAAVLIPDVVSVDTLQQVVRGLQYTGDTEETQAEQTVIPEQRTIFSKEKQDEFMQIQAFTVEEIAARSRHAPYIISVDEYMDGEGGYDQHTLTYFEGDRVLIDEFDVPILEPDPLIGLDNLSQFGRQSRDRQTIYIRNEKEERDFEIVRSQRSYGEEVLGNVNNGHSRRRGEDE